MKISYSFGIIDLFHYGHLCALKKASEGSDFHVFGLVSDETATSWQGKIVSSEQERKTVLESIRYIDKVMPQRTFDPTENIKQLHELYTDAKITLYHGSDMTVIPAELYLKSIGGEVEIVDYYEKLSPIKILEALNHNPYEKLQHTNIMSTKANTLLALQTRLKKSLIEKIFVCTVWQYQKKYESLFQKIKETFQGKKIVVRSSSQKEDSFLSSNAGHYESVLNVTSSNYEEVKQALQAVSQSYEKDSESLEQEQILIQTQTSEIACSGVVFTRDIQSNRPYYVINYDEEGSTNLVTSGGGGKAVWIARDIEEADVPKQWVGLLNAVKEIEVILNYALLDIEFAVKRDETVVIFQVRPLAANYKYRRNKESENVLEIKNRVCQEYEKFRTDDRYLLSDMAFWNPAEMIGNQPHPLDYSLYKEVITHRAWNQGLVGMGYQEVQKDLMYKFGNKPYICVDDSFRSLIPSELGEVLTEKLVNFYRKKLSKDYTAHDKIEFEIVMSCFDLETEDRLEELREEGFSEEERYEIRRALFDLTYQGIRNYPMRKKRDLADLKRLEQVRGEVEIWLHQREEYDTILYVQQIQRLLEALKTYGTPQFSRQARYAFIAKALCRSMVAKDYITAAEYEDFMKTMRTVAKQFEQDFYRLLKGELPLEDFCKEYGHLRGGTYDIRTLRYDAGILLSEIRERNYDNREVKGNPLPKEKVEAALKKLGMSIRFSEFEAFLKDAMEQREYFKFIFTKSLSRILEMIAEVGSHLGLERKEMSYLEIPQILSLQFYHEEKSRMDAIKLLIEMQKEQYREYQKLILPEVITKPSDFDVIPMAESRPNFVTEKKIEAPIVLLERDGMDAAIEGKIVVIEKADPGFDWIFTKGLVGLMTKYGGVASHMAIRCAEFEIPAAIGCGERIFTYIQKQSNLLLDCKNGKIVGKG